MTYGYTHNLFLSLGIKLFKVMIKCFILTLPLSEQLHKIFLAALWVFTVTPPLPKMLSVQHLPVQGTTQSAPVVTVFWAKQTLSLGVHCKPHPLQNSSWLGLLTFRLHPAWHRGRVSSCCLPPAMAALSLGRRDGAYGETWRN